MRCSTNIQETQAAQQNHTVALTASLGDLPVGPCHVKT